MILFDLLSTLEQKACLAGLDHAQIVMAVAAGDGLEADGDVYKRQDWERRSSWSKPREIYRSSN